MSGIKVLVAGASIAGPALAHWLRRRGAEVTVVERAPGLRPGGQAVDVRGIRKEVVRRMGLDERIGVEPGRALRRLHEQILAHDPALDLPAAALESATGSGLPGGTVTFLFTDIEGSTRLLAQLGPRVAVQIAQHSVDVGGECAVHLPSAGAQPLVVLEHLDQAVPVGPGPAPRLARGIPYGWVAVPTRPAH